MEQAKSNEKMERYSSSGIYEARDSSLLLLGKRKLQSFGFYMNNLSWFEISVFLF